MNKENIHVFMQKEISRKDFLRYIGLALLSLIGLSQLLAYLGNNIQQADTNRSRNINKGYGVSTYGR